MSKSTSLCWMLAAAVLAAGAAAQSPKPFVWVDSPIGLRLTNARRVVISGY